ncbi:hypothetical protein G5C60_17485 [Streptomyces sp. HC44]|uniref:Uncharacterized protein n=1 Tax=Streptomyces scabichelini TaxID=2711217 RepID=A0A6G4V5I2_9ACTN|nr:hypothetical protein [Streptomyces scabichelini]NGO09342.1 hypothetical protein [Streptomyces scabichelini]
MNAPHTDLSDLAELTGGWVNFDTTATGIRLVDVIDDEGRLALTIAEGGPGVPDSHTALTATALLDPDGDGQAVGFLAEGRLGSLDAILCGYLNRGLLTIDVHTSHPDDRRTPPVMYRAHYYRPEHARPSASLEGAPLP